VLESKSALIPRAEVTLLLELVLEEEPGGNMLLAADGAANKALLPGKEKKNGWC